jgi:diguanylate cyclase (GGDEF)-like protein
MFVVSAPIWNVGTLSGNATEATMRLSARSARDPHTELPRRTLLAVAGGYISAVLVVGLVWWQSSAAELQIRGVAKALSLAGAAFAAVCTAWAARSARGRIRRGWVAMTAGLMAWLAGASMWTLHSVWGVSASALSIVTCGALILFSLGAGMSLFYFSPRASWTSRTRLILDAAIVAASLFVVCWVIVLERIFHASDSRLTAGLTLTYLIAQVLLVAITALVWVGECPAQRRNVGLLGAGVALSAISAIPVPYLSEAGRLAVLVDSGRVAAFGLLALAALRAIHEPTVAASPLPMASKVRLWLPYLPLPLAVFAWFAQVIASVEGALLIMAVILVVTVLARQAVVLIENQRLLADVSRLAFRDPLTGLVNRALMLHRLGQAVERHRRDRISLAVLCLDLDNFKTVNDEMGHPAGDELLMRVAIRLLECVRAEDTVARLGGDEFAVLIEGSAADSLRLADGILGEFETPIMVDGAAIIVRPSIGVTVATPDMVHVDVDALLRRADLAMYAAKRDGGGCVRTFSPGSPESAERPLSAVPDGEPVAAASDVRPPRVATPLMVRVAFGALLAGVAVFAVSTLVRPGPGRITVLDSWWEVGLEFLAAGLVALRAWRVSAERHAWLCIAAGMTATAMGSVVYAVWVPEGTLPSAADAVYLAFYPLMYTGLVLLIRAQVQSVPAGIRLDALVVGLPAAAVAAALTAGPIAAAMSGAPATVLVGLAYPAGGLLLLALATGTLAVLGWRGGYQWALIVGAFVLWVVANTTYLFQTTKGSYLEGTWIDACWPTAFLLLALASWAAPAAVRSATEGGLAPLVSAVWCAVVALGVSVFARDDELSVTLSALALVAIAARFALASHDVNTRWVRHRGGWTSLSSAASPS